MATNGETATTAPPSEGTSAPEPWSKADLESALAHLERLQDQIDGLRSAIPDLLRPLQTAGVPRTKADVLLEVRNAAVKRSAETKALSEGWRAEGTGKILERARESEARDGDLGRCVEVPRWGWGEKVRARGEGDVVMGEGNEA